MYDDYMRIVQGGLRSQLKWQTTPDVRLRLRNLISTMNVDAALGSCYLNRLLGDEKGFDEQSAYWCRYLVFKHLQSLPFDPQVLEIGVMFESKGRIPALKAEVEVSAPPAGTWEKFKAGDGTPEEREAARRALALIIKGTPSCLTAAQKILEYSRRDRLDPRMHLMAFRPSRAAGPEWAACLFRHYAAIGMYDKARKVWEGLSMSRQSETTLNFAAGMFMALGETDMACAMYERSLALDPLQTPVRLRLRQLREPFAVDASLVGKRKVCIYLYTWNKARVFGNTLDSLATTRIGDAKIKVLVNGCTDDTRAVAESARDKFPDNDFEIIETPVNIGAPAARNWLINHADTWESDYVAFLDDDVTLQEDWLEHFLSVMETDPQIGVVGAKVVTPDERPYIQYLCRHVDVATDDMFKMSIEAPIEIFDDGLYDYVRPCRSVMGCQHMFSVRALRDVPQFDIRFSPSQVDDIDHDLMLCLKGHKVMYTGLVTCIHHQSSGVGQHSASKSLMSMGNALGNDLKLSFKHYFERDTLARMDSLSLLGDDAPDPFSPAARPTAVAAG